MFTTPVTQSYDLTDATWEIVLMLLVSFLLGWFFHWFWSRTASEDVSEHEFARYKADDLKIVEGIGPKIEELLKKHGVHTWDDLAKADVVTLKHILTMGGDRFQMHDPSSWADQASLASSRKWKDLEEYQNLLTGGRTFQA